MGTRLRHKVRRPSGPGLVLALLGLVALASALAVVGFMAAAIRNARLATEQRLSELYQGQLQTVEEALDRFWVDHGRKLETTGRLDGSIAFAEIVHSGIADSVIRFRTDRGPGYPALSTKPTPTPQEATPEWNVGRDMEFRRDDPVQAASIYERIASEAASVQERARGLLAQARCQFKAGDLDGALVAWSTLVGDPALAESTDEHGDLIAPNALLRILQTSDDSALVKQSLDRLQQRLNDYEDPGLSAQQRLFLMEQAAQSFDAAAFSTLEAERLAADVVNRGVSVPTERGLHPGPRTGLWTYAIPEIPLVALYRTDTILQTLQPIIDELALPGTFITIHPPRDPVLRERPLPDRAAGSSMPGWHLTFGFPGVNPFAEAYLKEQRIYIGTGILAISLIALFAFAIARLLLARLRLVRLQKDLVSNVAHELRTPVASIRALTDTLRAGRYRQPEQLVRYLELLTRESARLGEVIDHFLTFSRMEHVEQPLQFEQVSMGDIASASVTRARHRFATPDADLQVELEPGLPAISADPEALQTVVLNLLDNAWKYTGEVKEVKLRAFRRNNRLCLAVEDNGIGLTPLQIRHIFDRYYQADAGPTRSRGGCGLGLSIVRWIVEAHGGSVEVESERGRGSRFTVCFPIDASWNPTPTLTDQASP